MDAVFCISDNPMATMEGTQNQFKLKDDKIDPPDMYLGTGLTKIYNESNLECWAMSSDQYCAAAVANVTESLNKKGLRLPSICVTSLANGYRLEVDVTPELRPDGLQYYQELIVVL